MFSEPLRDAAMALLASCRRKGWKIATAESCTGGLISALLTEISGSSDIFERGFVTYSYESKTELLDVDAEEMKAHGAVSELVAKAMAQGVLKHTAVDLAVGVTGIAGPGGGTPGKPVGMVCMAVANRAGIKSSTHYFSGSRSDVRLASVAKAIEMMQAAVQE